MARAAFSEKERKAIESAEAVWSEIQPINDMHIEAFRRDGRSINALKGALRKAVKELTALSLPTSLTRSWIEGDLSRQHINTSGAGKWFPGAPIEYLLVTGGRSYLCEELQRLQLLVTTLSKIAPKKGPPPALSLRNFVEIAAREWLQRVGKKPSAKGRFLAAIHDIASDTSLKQLSEEFVHETLNRQKKKLHSA